MQTLKRRIIIETLILSCLLGLIFWILGRGRLSLGVLIGAAFGTGCFQLLAGNIQTSLRLRFFRIKPYFFLKYLIRYAIMGGLLFFCAQQDLQIFFGASAGLLLVYIAIYLDTFIINRECKIPAK